MPSSSDVQNLITAEQHPFVEKFLIFYPDLPTICEGTMDESSCLDELTQHVLYFYPGDRGVCWNMEPQDGDGGIHTAAYANEQAVQFLGLCEALLTFPSAFCDDQDDRTREVRFGNSTIIFCPLEKDGEILAAVQVSNGSSPLAVRTSIQRSHDMFCLLRGGGILPRLKSSHHIPDAERKFLAQPSFFEMFKRSFDIDFDNITPPESSEDNAGFQSDFPQQEAQNPNCCGNDECLVNDGCIFPGMKTLYQLRKAMRKKTSSLSKLSSLMEMKRNTIEEELENVTLNLNKLCSLLPITSIRRDLTTHYDDFLQQASLSNKCLVEMVPRPIDESTCSASLGVPGMDNIRQTISSLLKHSCQGTDTTYPHLVAISTFYRGNLLFNQSLLGLKEDSTNSGIPNKTASEIMRYMAYYEQRMQLQPSKQLPLRLRRRTTSTSRLQQSIQDSLLQLNLSDRTLIETEQQDLVTFGSYLSSPPLSMLNIADELYDISDSGLGNVWTPLFYVLVDGKHYPVKVARYTVKDVTFLVYVDAGGEIGVSSDSFERSANALYEDYFSAMAFPAAVTQTASVEAGTDVESQQPFAELLAKISWILSVCVDEAAAVAEDDSAPTPPTAISQEKGIDVVYIDRFTEDVVLQLNQSERMGRLAKSTRGISTERDESDDGPLASDLRHQLLTRLAPDAVAAFDDMMNVIHGKSGGDGVELCTFLPHGWVWAASSGDRELYMVFDPAEHGTINDVEQTGERIRQFYFNQATKFA